jgi:hypothetical protein
MVRSAAVRCAVNVSISAAGRSSDATPFLSFVVFALPLLFRCLAISCARSLDREPSRVSDADDDTGAGNILRCPALGPLRQRIDFVAERADFRRCGFWRLLTVPGRDPGIINKRVIGRYVQRTLSKLK